MGHSTDSTKAAHQKRTPVQDRTTTAHDGAEDLSVQQGEMVDDKLSIFIKFYANINNAWEALQTTTRLTIKQGITLRNGITTTRDGDDYLIMQQGEYLTKRYHYFKFLR